MLLAQKTQEIYERNGPRFDMERPKVLYEKEWLSRFQELLPPRAKILDAGCGAGEPIAQYFICRGFDLTGIDFSQSILDIAKSRFPDHQWLQMDMRKLNLEKKFEGIIAWHSFFHLIPEDQRETLKCFSNHLTPGGVLLLTIGHEEGEVIGNVGDDKVYHASLSIEEYTSILNSLNIETIHFVPEDPHCGGTSVLLAQKKEL